jgi:ABC-type nitrate/sulfonate/bicarbonate transport system substrate-binding protein
MTRVVRSPVAWPIPALLRALPYAVRWALGVAAAAMVAISSAAQAQELEKTTIRYEKLTGAQISYPELADALGYLAPLKLQRLGTVAGGPADVQAAATGQVDYGQAFNGAIINLIAAGAPVTAVLGYHGADGQDYFGAWVLEGSSIHSARDLIGKKVGVNALGAAMEAYVDEYLTRGGLTQAEIKQIVLVPVPQATAELALRQKQVDVVILNSGLQDQAIERGGIRMLFSDYQMFGKYTSASIVMRNDFAKKYPNTASYFIRAVAKAIDWSQTHTREQLLAVYAPYLKAKGFDGEVAPLQYWKTQAVANRGGWISPQEFQRWIDWERGKGILKDDRLKAADVYSNALNPYTPGSP